MASYSTYLGIGTVYVPNTLLGLNNFSLKRRVELNYDGYLSSSYPLNTTVGIKAHQFVPDSKGYHTLKFTETAEDIRDTIVDNGSFVNGTFTGAEIALCDKTPTEENISEFTYTSTSNVIVTDNKAGETQYFAMAFNWRNSRNGDTYTLYWAFKVQMPTLVAVDEITMSHETSYMLTESGSAPIDMVISNPNSYIIRGKFDTDKTYSLSTNLTTATVNYNFTIEDVGDKIYTIEILGGSATEDNTVYYFYDENAEYHAINGFYTTIYSNEEEIVEYKNRQVYVENPTINYPISLVDNSNIFVLNSASISSVKSNSSHGSAMFYLTETGAVALKYSFKYTASGSNTYRVRLYDSSRSSGTQFINQSFTYSSAGTHSNTLYSSTLTKVESVNMMLEITDSHNRILKKDFGLVTIRAYDRPKISYFDAYFSNSNGTMNTQAIYCSVLANFTYSSLDGNNTLTQKLTAVDNSTGKTITTISPSLTTGTRKYIGSSIKLPLGTTYTLTLTLTDTLGNTASSSFVLDRGGNVLMDFNNTGYGMAIGKLSEQNALEINLPTVFYNTVDYIDGERQVSDAASVLGFMDTYSTGCRTIQEVLDYIIQKLV